MTTRWQPWQTPLPNIPRAVMVSWWNRIRPDLALPREKQKSKVPGRQPKLGNLSSGNTGCIQKIKLVVKEISPTLNALSFNGICHVQMKDDVYKIQLVLNVNKQIAQDVVSSACNCICGKELGTDALCVRLLALLYHWKTDRSRRESSLAIHISDKWGTGLHLGRQSQHRN